MTYSKIGVTLRFELVRATSYSGDSVTRRLCQPRPDCDPQPLLVTAPATII
jgi:hypothetical protein